MLKKVKVIILALVVVIAGISVYGYLATRNNKSYPDITANNTVVNETVQGHFLNWTTTPPLMHLFYQNATTSVLFGNQSSNLTIDTIVSPSDNNVVGYVQISIFILVFGYIAPGLHPDKLLLNMSDLGPYSNGDAKGYAGEASNVPPYNVTDTTAGPANNIIKWQNFSIQPVFNLVNQTKQPVYYYFGLEWQPQVNFFTPRSGGIGTHILHLTASLEGLGQPVFVTINVTLIDTD